jgi:hypothetical protein
MLDQFDPSFWQRLTLGVLTIVPQNFADNPQQRFVCSVHDFALCAIYLSLFLIAQRSLVARRSFVLKLKLELV